MTRRSKFSLLFLVLFTQQSWANFSYSRSWQDDDWEFRNNFRLDTSQQGPLILSKEDREGVECQNRLSQERAEREAQKQLEQQRAERERSTAMTQAYYQLRQQGENLLQRKIYEAAHRAAPSTPQQILYSRLFFTEAFRKWRAAVNSWVSTYHITEPEHWQIKEDSFLFAGIPIPPSILNGNLSQVQEFSAQLESTLKDLLVIVREEIRIGIYSQGERLKLSKHESEIVQALAKIYEIQISYSQRSWFSNWIDLGQKTMKDTQNVILRLNLRAASEAYILLKDFPKIAELFDQYRSWQRARE